MAETYTVKKGDTLNAIANQYGFKNYKEAGISSVPSGNFDLIRPGETITLGNYTAPTPAASKTPGTDIPITNPNNPVISSTNVRGNIDALGNEIKTAYDSSSLTKTSEANTKLIEDRMKQLDERRKKQIEQIQRDYEAASLAQGKRQEKDYAGRATGLVTSGGGFLGTTQSQEGVLENLRQDHEAEKGALMSKRDAAIQAAQTAYEDKDFELAAKLVSEAKDTEQEIYNRQKDFANEQLALAKEARAQKEFDIGLIDKKVEGYSSMDDTQYNNVTPEEKAKIDQFYFPGYTDAKRKADQLVSTGKSLKNSIELQSALQTLINKTPYGQKITLPNGSTYVGMKSAGSTSTKGLISPELANQLKMPSLSGKKESDVILSLNLSNPPEWFKEYYRSITPYAQTQQSLESVWKDFTQQPDIEAYKNSAVISGRIQSAEDNNTVKITPEDIQDALENA